MAKVYKREIQRTERDTVKIRRLFRTAAEISPRTSRSRRPIRNIRTNACSKTINLQGNSKREDVAHIYIRAYEKGLKGITIFRYGSKKGTMVQFQTDVD